VVRQLRGPGGIQQAGLGHGIDVSGQRQRDDIGLQPVDDRAGLFAGAAVGLLDLELLAVLLFPIRGKGLVDFGIKFPRRIIGNIEQSEALAAALAVAGSQAQQHHGGEGDEGEWSGW